MSGFVVLSLVSSVQTKVTVWKECLQNYLFVCQVQHQTCIQSFSWIKKNRKKLRMTYDLQHSAVVSNVRLKAKPHHFQD